MIEKKFGGFTEKQMEAVARKIGHAGPMEKFNEFLAEPENAAKLSRMTEKARSFVEAAKPMAGGGVVAQGYNAPDGNYYPSFQAWQDKRHENMAKGLTPEGKPYSKEEAEMRGIKPGEGVQIEGEKTGTKPKPGSDTGGDGKGGTTGGGMNVKSVGQTMVTDPEKFVTESKTSTIDAKSNQFLDKDSGQAPPAQTVTGTPMAPTALAAAIPDGEAHTYEATKGGPEVEQAINDTQAVQGTVGANSQVTAAQALPSADATVQGQLTKLMQQFEGGQTPPWAAGAKRMADQVMMQRGLGASSMAASATTQAMMESAIGIAAADAQTFSQFEMANLNNRQQARLQNAQSFLQMDLANLDIASQTNLFKSQARIQSLFTDQAADNAAKQFNATSENQTEQFFSQLKSQVSQFNAAQKNGMNMFKTEQGNSIKMFNSEMKAARDQFNAANRLIVDQSNVQWRRTITTTNNAEQNENNRLNAQLSTGLTTQAYNNLWQTERDLMQFAFTAAENASQRAHEIVMQKMNTDAYEDAQDKASKDSLWKDVGAFAFDRFEDWWG
jgi:hypothetical protein